MLSELINLCLTLVVLKDEYILLAEQTRSLITCAFTVRYTKHPRRNHYSDKVLLAIHTVVAYYHTKESALAPAM